MRLRIVYFAAARELAECASEELSLEAESLTLEEFVSWLGKHKPRLAGYLSRMRFARNGEFAHTGESIADGDEVTVLPPVAGGSVLAEVRDHAISIDEVVAAVRRSSAGAVAVFIGLVRDHHGGKAVQRLDYEAYRELANKEMARILRELGEAHPEAALAALHRVGELAIGDVAVVVAASSPHRDLAFTLCRLAIDRIKASVPIWKKEWGLDGSGTWINLESDERT